MPTANLTAEQHQAIDTRDVSVALSAGAGCGKTHVLTARFLSHLDPAVADAAELRQLIAITFTDAAAREMRSRIRDTCYRRLRDPDLSADEQGHWLRLMREIDAARVSTIHAFCASLLRDYAAQAGLDPNFGVLDQGDADVLQYDVIDDVLRGQLADQNDDTLNLAAAYGLERLKQQIAALLKHRHDDSFRRWLAASPEQMLMAWRQWHAHDAFPNAVREIAEAAPIGEILRLLRKAQPRKDNQKFVDARGELFELLPPLAAGAATTEQLTAICQQARVRSICSAKDWPTKDDYDLYRAACEALRKCVEKSKPAEWVEAAARETAEFGLALLRLAAKAADTYQERKAAQSKLDFDDLLAAAYQLLTNPQSAELCQQLADDLRLLLVDEFQDTDQLQANLVKALCGRGFDQGRLFFVGDFKQSIYRFRGAQPKVFSDLQGEIPKSGQLPLNVNFRSQPAVLHFVNALFRDTFGDKYEPLRPNRKQATQEPAVEFLWAITPDKNTNAKGAKEEARRKEAEAIARRLRALADGSNDERPIVDKQTGQPRRLELGDVAILFRTLSDIQVYEAALRDYGLDYYLVGGHAFYAQQEIYDVLNLLRAVASTADDVSLAGVLRSPFFALEDETLFWLVEAGAGSLNAGLLADGLPPQLAPGEQSKAAAAADTLRALRTLKDRVSIALLLGETFHRTGYDAVLLAEFLGQRKLANLQKLIERARAADQSGTTELDGFITQLAQFIAQEPKEALAATMPETANVIRLMTIHHAKGLEFPLVVVPDLDRLPQFRPPPAALHRDFGPLVPPPADDDQKKVATGMSLFAAQERREETEERKRLLYVACTRAADHLILSSSLEAYDKPKSDWMKLIADRFDLESGDVRVELPDGYDVPRVRVEKEPTTDHRPASKSRGPDLITLLEQAHELADHSDGAIPREVAAVPVDRAARRQFSFSRLTGWLMRSDADHAASPEDEQSAAAPPLIDPRGLGSLVHDVLERLDFDHPNGIAGWCEHLAPQYVLGNADQAARLACEMIERFAASARRRQFAAAAALHREVEFLLAWPSGLADGDGRYVQGYIDCLYQDASGGWHLVDYKTNDVTAADVPNVAQKYELQLYVYALAAERALGQPPVELVLHFLRPGVEHVFEWNDAARRHAVDMVTQAITTYRSSDWSLW